MDAMQTGWEPELTPTRGIQHARTRREAGKLWPTGKRLGLGESRSAGLAPSRGRRRPICPFQAEDMSRLWPNSVRTGPHGTEPRCGAIQRTLRTRQESMERKAEG